MSVESLAARLERLFRLRAGGQKGAIDLSADSTRRIDRLLEKLGDPHRHLPPTVHVAGTNGKGSTIAFLRAMAEAAGLRVHAYTSPHLVRFNERIVLAGQEIDDDLLEDVLVEVEEANEGAPITFFEITTVAAFVAFARVPADLLLLETGMGGRLDTTNVVTRPVLTVITPIDLDHREFLGNTITAIAGEKAGIMKPDVPCVLGPQADEALAVFCERADVLDAPLIAEGADYATRPTAEGFVFRGGGRENWVLPRPALEGPHQIVNAATAVATALLLDLPEDAIERGLREARWPARMQRLTRGPLVEALPAGCELWLDGGHNPHGARAQAAALAALGKDGRPAALVIGLLSTKDAAGSFAAFAPLAPPVVAVTIPSEEQARPAAEIAAAATAAGLAAETAPSLESAVARAAERAGAQARVLIAGSLHLAGRILAANG